MDCSSHEGQGVVLVCVSCNNEMICPLCVDESHYDHSVSSLEDAEQKIRKDLKDVTDNKPQTLLDLDTQLNKVLKAQEHQKSILAGTREKIQERRTALHEVVNAAADDILSEFEDRQKTNLDHLQAQQQMITQKMTEVNDIEARVKEVLKIDSIPDLIRASRTITAPSIDQDFQLPSTVELQDGTVNSKQMQNMYGTVVDMPGGGENEENPSEQNIEMSVQTEFEVDSYRRISSLLTLNRGLCFVTVNDLTILRLVDETKHVHQRVELSVEALGGFDMCQKKNIYICCQVPNCIKHIEQPQGFVSTIFSTGELKPTALCCTSSGELLVTLVDDDWRRDPSRIGSLVRFNTFGKDLATVEQDEFEENLFVLPTRVRINKSEDTIAVINQVDEDRSFLVLLGNEFKVKTRYLGDGKIFKGNTKFTLPDADEENRIMFSDIVFDSNGNMIISEVFSLSVQLLNPSCVVLQTLHQDRDSPHALAIGYDAKLWVGIGWGQGTITILKED